MLPLAAAAQCPRVDLGRTGEIYGAVRATGASIAGAKVLIEPADHKRPPINITLGPDGHYRFLRLPAGKYLLAIHRKGLLDANYAVELSPHLRRKPIEIILPMAGSC
ncbi:MAG: carboxypeptidase regulatory-like domain-containing protein [Acidobacteria bacterium]|nr:carboxypeptidase regulatory-like domain-containing protein [Acidobacteriota bacterium]